MTETLLAIMSALVGALIWVVKKNGATNDLLIENLIRAVDSFRLFQAEETATHTSILETQRAILEAIERLDVKLDKALEED